MIDNENRNAPCGVIALVCYALLLRKKDKVKTDFIKEEVFEMFVFNMGG